jgi:hypothetical protein
MVPESLPKQGGSHRLAQRSQLICPVDGSLP